MLAHRKILVSGSLAERMVDRGSLSRASLGRGSLGRFSVATDVSASSAATRHWVNSVSDIYGQDEIEELLQDLNRLELATLDTDKFQVEQLSPRTELELRRLPCCRSLTLMGLMWVELASSFPQVLVRQLPPPSYPGLAPQEQFPGLISKDSNFIIYDVLCAAGLGTATPTTSSSGNLLTTTAAGGDLAIFLGPYMLRFVPSHLIVIIG